MTTHPPTPLDRLFLNRLDDVGQLILVRHGQQQWPDPDNSVSGDWVDPPLSELGRRQAAAVGEYLAQTQIDAVYSSALSRAHDTGKAIAGHHDLEPIVRPDLREIQFYGELPDDKRASDILGPDVVKAAGNRFLQERRWDVYPATESSLSFRRRVGIEIEAALIDRVGQTVVIACHGGVINIYLAELLGLDADMFFRPAHASVHRLSFGHDRRVITSLAEIPHLVGDLHTV